jgi:hypothetical protein
MLAATAQFETLQEATSYSPRSRVRLEMPGVTASSWTLIGATSILATATARVAACLALDEQPAGNPAVAPAQVLAALSW